MYVDEKNDSRKRKITEDMDCDEEKGPQKRRWKKFDKCNAVAPVKYHKGAMEPNGYYISQGKNSSMLIRIYNPS